MKRKIVVCLLVCAAILTALTACQKTRADYRLPSLPKTNSVKRILNSKIEEESGSGAGKIPKASKTPQQRIEEARLSQAQQEAKSTDGVDYDLTDMNRDLVYAMLYQFMLEPLSYEGKIVRMTGVYDNTYDESKDSYRHFCVVSDQNACCTLALEFNLAEHGDGTGDYPEKNSPIVVQGTLKSYQPEGASFYSLLIDEASLG